MVWYPHLFQNFPQFIVIHTVKGFGIVKKAEIDVFLELSCFFDDPADVSNLISGSTGFSKTWTLADYKGGEGLKADICQEGRPDKMEMIKILGGYFKGVVRLT